MQLCPHVLHFVSVRMVSGEWQKVTLSCTGQVSHVLVTATSLRQYIYFKEVKVTKNFVFF